MEKRGGKVRGLAWIKEMEGRRWGSDGVRIGDGEGPRRKGVQEVPSATK